MKELKQIREEIDAIDSQLAKLIEKRLRLADAVAAAKQAGGQVVNDPTREREILTRVSGLVDRDVASGVRMVYSTLFGVSKARQRVRMDVAAFAEREFSSKS